MKFRALAVTALAAAAALTLSACATGTLVDPDSNGQEVPGGDGTDQALIEAAWLDGGRMIGIVTEGSSTCVPEAGDVALDGTTLDVTFTEPDEGTPCTMDLAPRVSLVPVPEGVDPQEDLEISVTGAGFEGGVTLSGVEGLSPEGPSDMTPSAGWTNMNGIFVVLLWGSSSCPEYITATEVTGEDTVTASLSGLPADKACTMDLASNPQIAFADGLQGVEGVELTLEAPTADAVTIPILGANNPVIPAG